MMTGKEVYFEADYVPSAYQTTPPVTAGTARSTGNAFNEPLQSGIGTITVKPIIEITLNQKGQLLVKLLKQVTRLLQEQHLGMVQ